MKRWKRGDIVHFWFAQQVLWGYVLRVKAHTVVVQTPKGRATLPYTRVWNPTDRPTLTPEGTP